MIQLKELLEFNRLGLLREDEMEKEGISDWMEIVSSWNDGSR